MMFYRHSNFPTQMTWSSEQKYILTNINNTFSLTRVIANYDDLLHIYNSCNSSTVNLER